MIMSFISAKIRQKIAIWPLIVKLVIFSSFGLFLPMQALATDTLDIRDIEIILEQDQATIKWYTNLSATSRLDYGLTTDYGQYVNDTSADARYHSLKIFHLEADQTYHFKITSASAGQTVSSFDMIFDTDDYNDGLAPKFENFHERYITGQTATLQWETSEKSTVKIYYGTSLDYGKTKTITKKNTTFEVTLDKLAVDTKYFYQIEIKDEDGNIRTRQGDFHTLVTDEADKRLLEITKIRPVTTNDEAISYTAATVSWHVNKLADGVVYYSTNANKINKKINNLDLFKDFDQSAHISGLKPDILYYFQVEVTDVFGKKAKSSIMSFKTKYLPANLQQASNPVVTKIKDLRKLFTSATSLYKDSASGKIYSIVNNQKHLIINSNFFDRYGYSLNQVKTVTSNFLNNFASVRLVKDPTTDKIYYLAKKGNDHWLKIDLPTPTVFSSYAQNKWSDVVTIDKQELDNFSSVNLVKTQGGKTVYFLENGVKRPIASASVFESKGFNWSDIVELSQTHLDAYFTGSTLR